jgi:hypothetical protein
MGASGCSGTSDTNDHVHGAQRNVSCVLVVLLVPLAILAAFQ